MALCGYSVLVFLVRSGEMVAEPIFDAIEITHFFANTFARSNFDIYRRYTAFYNVFQAHTFIWLFEAIVVPRAYWAHS